MQKGFGLIELSIVLVIIGLIVGGIIVGRDLIRSAEVRSIQSDAEKIATAVNLFRLKVGGLPGDTKRASSYLTGVVDGDGDGIIDYNGGFYSEEYEVWDQLATAGFIEGSYTGGTDSIFGSDINRGYFRLSYQTSVYGMNKHLISFNRLEEGYATAFKSVLSADEVYAMDLKSDDGKADSGNIMGFNEDGQPGCVTNDKSDGSGDYVVPSSEINCKVFFGM